jgi:hypothetical protein
VQQSGHQGAQALIGDAGYGERGGAQGAGVAARSRGALTTVSIRSMVVRSTPGMSRRMCRFKMISTLAGRPTSRLSAISADPGTES